MRRVKLPKKKPELYKCICCKGCTKKCISNAKIATKEHALKNNTSMICNNTTEKTFKTDELVPKKKER